MYKQLRAFNQSLAGKVKGSCLANTRKGFSILAKYPSAWSAWMHTPQHTGTPPSGVEVPVFFSYKGEDNGHVGVQLSNGKFWSDGNIYDSIAAYEANHSPRYVGWSESIDGVQVLQYYVLPQIFHYTNYVPANAVGRRVYLSARCKTWRVYKPGTRTHVGTLLPAANGGLSYIVRGIDTLPNRVLIQSGTFGKVSLPVDSDATFK